MKTKLLFLLTLTLFTFKANAQCTGNVNIPNADFKNALLNNHTIDLDNNNEISCTEASNYTGEIDVNSLYIDDLTGIEAFINITSLILNRNYLEELDISKNTALTSLSFSDNYLTSIDLSKNTALTYLSCGNNKLTSLDVSNNTQLETLYAGSNEDLTSLDVSSNTVLTKLYLLNNEGLTQLNVANGNNSNFDTSVLNFKGTTDLTCIKVDNTAFANNNWSSLKDATARYSENCDTTVILDVNFEQALITKGFDSGSPDGTVPTDNISGIATLSIEDKEISDLTGIEDFVSLTSLSVSNNNLTSLDLSNNTALTELDCSYNDLTSLDVTQNSALIDLNCSYNDLTALNLEGNTNLDILNISVNNLINGLDVSKNTALTQLSINFSNLASLDVTKNIALELLYIPQNNLTSLDVSQNTALTRLECFKNNLTSLDVSNNTALTNLSCFQNNLTTLDLRNTNISLISATSNPNLTCISVDDVNDIPYGWMFDTTVSYSEDCNATTAIPDANFEQALIDLEIDDVIDGAVLTANISGITSLFVRNKNISDLTGIEDFIALETLYVDRNNLTSLDVSNNTALDYLVCYENSLTSLDLSNNVALTKLNCNSNNLTSLDVSANTSLIELYCSSNNLTSLNVANGNNSNFNQDTNGFYVSFTSNPNLSCIKVDNATFANNNWSTLKDATATYSEDCGTTAIPDANFEQALIDLEIDDVIDGAVLTANISGLTTLNVSGENIADLTGIEDFTALTELYISNNVLTSLDVTKNTALIHLNVEINNLTILNVTKNTALTELRCSENSLSTLDVTKNTALNDLACYMNNLTSLDISNNIALTDLNVFDNNLTSLNVSNNAALINLSVSDNNLTSLDVSNNTALTSLSVSKNELSSLDVSNNTALTVLSISETSLTSLDVSTITNLIWFDAIDNANLTCIQVDNVANIGTNWNKDATATYSEDCSATVALTYVPDDNFEQALIDLEYDDVLDDYVLTANISGLTSLLVRDKNISDLTGIEDFIALETLYVDRNNLTNIDVSNNTALNYLVCYENNLTSLGLSNNVALTKLNCSSNNLTSLDVSANTSLIELYCSSNSLTSLDLSNNTALTKLSLGTNNLTSVNISANTNLTELNLGVNSLTSIDISANTSLIELEVESNNLTTLDVTKNTALTFLDVSGNNLTSVDLSMNTDLTRLDLFNNNLTSLDISNNTNLDKFDVTDNTNLTCIQVDNVSNIGSSWYKDATATYSEDCSATVALTYVPDDNFEQALIDQGYDDVLDDYVLTDNISGITDLDVSNKNIADLTGIEDFIALTVLDIGFNDLTSLDVTKNTALTNLSCYGNNLTSLDISNNTALTRLSVFENNLTSLDVSNNTALTSLAVYKNNLTSLDVSNNTALTFLSLYLNELSSLDVTKNTALTTLNVGENSGLSTLDVTKNTALTYLSCYGNSLTSIDLSKNTDLTLLDLSENSLTNIDLSKNTALTELNIHHNSLTNLDLSENTALKFLIIHHNSLTNIDLSKITNLDGFDATNIPSLTCIQVDNVANIGTNWEKDATATYSEDCSATVALTYVPDNNFEQALIDQGYDDVLDDYVLTDNISGVTKLLLFNKGISDLTGIEDFTALTELTCTDSNLTSIDFSKNTGLIKLSIYNNNLTSIDLSKNTELTFLSIRNNELSSIDLSKNTALNYLSIINNKLTSIDLSKNTALTDLHIRENSLTNLDLSNNTNLIKVAASENNLTNIDITNAIDLIDLDVSENNLASLNITNNTALTDLNIDRNSLSSIDLTKNTALTTLYVYENNLSSIDLTKNTALDFLNIHNSNLTSIDVSKNIALTELNIRENNLTSLDISNNLNLDEFDATDNPNLTCIQVANVNNIGPYWEKDAIATYSEDCSATVALTYVPDDNFEQALINLGYDDVLDDYVPTNNINGLTDLDVRGENIADLTGIEDFIALTKLQCDNNNLTSLDLSKNTNLIKVAASENNLTSIDITNAIDLIDLDVSENNLASLNITNNTALTDLNIDRNSFSSIDLTKNTALTTLYVYENNLSSIDLTKNTALFYLNIQNNNLTSIDLSKNIALFNLNIRENNLTSLDLSNNTNLYEFEAIGNPNLTCIQVANVNNIGTYWYKDATASYSENCGELIVDCSNIENTQLTCKAELPSEDESLPIVTNSVGAATISVETISSNNSGCLGDPLIITRTYTISDEGGNSEECIQTFTVESINEPTIDTDLRTYTEELDANCQYQLPDYTALATSTADCGTATITQSPAAGTIISGEKDTEIILTATDSCERTATTSINLTTIVNTELTASTKDSTIQLDASGVVSITASQVDNGSNLSCNAVSLTLDKTTFNCSNIGENTVTLTVTDTSGNSATATAIITVEDNIAPTVITQNIEIELNGNGTSSIVTADIDNGSSDNCEIASITLDKTEFDCTSAGENTVTLTVTDIHGNSNSETAIVTVVDKTGPTAVAQNITAQLDVSGVAIITANQIDNGSTANCGAANLTVDTTTFNCSNIGENTVTLTVTDTSGNSSTATAIVTVEDTLAPTVITQNIEVELDENGTSSIVAADIDNGSSDNCEIASITLDKTEFDCTSAGENTVTLTVTDIHGNSNSETAIVTVVDKTGPTAIAQNITAQLNASGVANITANQIDNGSTANCGTINLTLDKTTFNCSNIGENTVTLTVTDASGNSSTTTAIVTVEDTLAPTVITQNIEVELNGNGTSSIVVADINNGSSDNCEIASITLNKTEFDCTSAGENTVTLTVTDIHGNSNSKTAIVTVSETVAPVANCIAPFTLALDETGNATIIASQINNGSTDNCGITSINIDKESFDCSNIGENTVTLTVTDASGNKATCTTVVTIVDTTPPIVITKNISVELDSNGNANITTSDIDNGSFDACGIAAMSLDQTTFSCPTLIEHAVTLTVTDNYGNTASEIALVTFTSSDIDNDTIADICDTDIDGDGVDNNIDNCPTTANSDQADLDQNGIGDVCDQSDLKIAKGFSPNGDGVNDEFIIEGLHNYPNNSIQIYNRYGNIVYESNNYQNYWDGIGNKEERRLPAAPYFYVLSINGGSKVVKGWVYINY
ncbi:gliding motility-associated C-terminal domain-containing protein [Lutibacter sp. A64]|uniref:T9SS type B sorting domain-containing protein n=1 Tax=Lutibacter sp. A64 TaxID=2918526 RepID=UPI001F063504|nr:gliding motility-associated C-terminal domain-containing protein [Lutibacter sp. A64]UMB53140.1 gliding motility-associated C-terminal domain-containing protein [Lutibacter sp. A64]